MAENFKGLDREAKSSDRDMKEYTDKEKAREEEREAEKEAPVNIFSGHVDPQDNGKREKPRSSMILLDRESSDKMGGIYYPQLWRKLYPCQSPAGTSEAGLHRNT